MPGRVGLLGLSWYHCPPGGTSRPCKLRVTVGSHLQGRGQVWVGSCSVPKLAHLPQMHTPDIGGQGTTSEAIQDIIRHIRISNGRAVEA